MTPSVAAPDDTKLSDVTGVTYNIIYYIQEINLSVITLQCTVNLSIEQCGFLCAEEVNVLNKGYNTV